MAQNDNDNIFDVDGIDTSGLLDEGNDGGYVPKFERDLEKMGSLEALSAVKKNENSYADADAISTDGLTLSSDEDYELKPAAQESNAYAGADDLVSVSLPVEEEPAIEEPEQEVYVEETLPTLEKAELPLAEPEAAADDGFDNPEELSDEDRLKALNSIDASSIQLADMDYDESVARSRALKKQMELDDMTQEIGAAPKVADMNEKYAPTKKKTSEILEKDQLDNEDKESIRKRLENEIGRRPEGYSKKKSLEMYHNLMNEQKIKKAKKGFFRVLIVIALGIVTAAITYFKIATGDTSGTDIFKYLAMATLAASLLLFVKAKLFKVLGVIYFALNTVALIGPGFVKFAMSTGASFDTEWIIMFASFVLAVTFSVYNCIQLCTSEFIEAYYTTQLISDKKKAFDDRKTKYEQ